MAKHQELAPRCPTCGKRQVRWYRYKKLANSPSGKWVAVGWGCEECQTVTFPKKA